jgi:phosphate starvation-inducible protein PhoH
MNKHQSPNRRQRRAKQPKNIFDSLNLELRTIEPKTANQQLAFDSFESGMNQMLLGSPGTGKSFIATYHALQALRDGKCSRVMIIRSAVSTRDQGFLPGSEEEKMAVYEAPYQEIVNELFGRADAYGLLKKHDLIQFESTSFMRGITLHHTFVVFDEIQNTTAHEASTILTRLASSSRIALCGDLMQQDLTRNNDRNVYKFINVIEHMCDYFDTTYFTFDDIVRSGMVKQYIITLHSIYHEGY